MWPIRIIIVCDLVSVVRRVEQVNAELPLGAEIGKPLLKAYHLPLAVVLAFVLPGIIDDEQLEMVVSLLQKAMHQTTEQQWPTICGTTNSDFHFTASRTRDRMQTILLIVCLLTPNMRAIGGSCLV